MSRLLKFILIFTLVLLVIVTGMFFHLRNDQKVVLDYFLGTADIYISVLAVLAFAFGALAGMIAGLPLLIKYRYQNVRLKRHIRISEKELDNLRVMPLKDSH